MMINDDFIHDLIKFFDNYDTNFDKLSTDSQQEDFPLPDCLIPYFADACSTVESCYAKIDAIYEADVIWYYKQAVKSEYYDAKFVTSKSLKQEIYVKKMLGILTAKQAWTHASEIMAMAYKRLWREIGNLKDINYSALVYEYDQLENENSRMGAVIFLIAYLRKKYVWTNAEVTFTEGMMNRFYYLSDLQNVEKDVIGYYDDNSQFVRKHTGEWKELFKVDSIGELLNQFVWQDSDSQLLELADSIIQLNITDEAEFIINEQIKVGQVLPFEKNKKIEVVKNDLWKVYSKNQTAAGKKFWESVTYARLRNERCNSDQYGNACAIIKAMEAIMKSYGLASEITSTITFTKKEKEKFVHCLNNSFSEISAPDYASLMMYTAMVILYKQAKEDILFISLNQKIETSNKIAEHLINLEKELLELRKCKTDNEKEKLFYINNRLNEKEYQTKISKLEKEIRDLKADNDKKQNRINDLCMKVEAIQTGDIDDDNFSVSVEERNEFLEKYRVTICAGHDSWQQQIREMFPEWKYIGADMLHFDSGILKYYEYVVYNTRVSNHSLYHKVIMNKPKQKSIIFVNGRNIEQSLWHIYHEITRMTSIE
jgi:hypothetical protein